jgi:hypothetical protein
MQSTQQGKRVFAAISCSNTARNSSYGASPLSRATLDTGSCHQAAVDNDEQANRQARELSLTREVRGLPSMPSLGEKVNEMQVASGQNVSDAFVSDVVTITARMKEALSDSSTKHFNCAEAKSGGSRPPETSQESRENETKMNHVLTGLPTTDRGITGSSRQVDVGTRRSHQRPEHRQEDGLDPDGQSPSHAHGDCQGESPDRGPAYARGDLQVRLRRHGSQPERLASTRTGKNDIE